MDRAPVGITKRGRIIAALCICVIHIRIAAGAEPGPFITEQELLADLPLVITASRLLQSPSKAPASVTVIDRKMIEASTALEIPDLLRLVPGFQVTYANGNIASVTYHGHEDEWSNRMQVLIDGRSVYTPLFSIVDWTHLDINLEDIQRIEVIRGPNAPVYGSNAFLATINIITRQPFQDRGTTVQATGGSRDTRQGLLRYSGQHGRLDYRATLSHHSDDGFEGVNDRKRLNSISFRGIYDATASDSVDLQLGATSGPLGAWGKSPQTSPDRDKDTRSYYGYTRWEHALSTSSGVHLQAYHNYLEWSDHYVIGPLSDLFGVDPSVIPLFFSGQPDQTLNFSFYDGMVTRSDIEFQHTLTPAVEWRIVWGIGYRKDTLESYQILGRRDALSDHLRRLFGNVEWRPTEAVMVNAGAMIEDNEIVNTQISPRLAASYEVAPGHTLRAVATGAVRSPSLYENYEYNVARFNDGTILDVLYMADGDLEPEEMTSYEFGYRATSPGGRIDTDWKIFREEITDIIYHPRDPTVPDLISTVLTRPEEQGAFVRVNGGFIDTEGVEFQVRYFPRPYTFLSFQYSYANASGRIIKGIEGDTPTRYQQDVDRNTPLHSASALFSHRFAGGLSGSLAYFYVSDMTWEGDGDPVPKYYRWDARISKVFPLWRGSGEISLVVQNFLDDAYLEFREENVFERRAFVQLSAAF